MCQPASIARLKAQWQTEYETWTRRALDRRYAYCWADGLYLKAGPEGEKTAVLIIIGVTEDGQKELPTMVEGYRESRESWRDALRDLRRRGLKDVRIFIGDGALGLWAAVNDIYPDARHQLCWCHKMLNVLDKLPQRLQPEAKTLLRDIYTAPARAEAETRVQRFAQRFQRDYPRAVASLMDHQAVLLTFYDFPREHWKSLRTSNPIESTFDPVRCGRAPRGGCAKRRQGCSWCSSWSGARNADGGGSTDRIWWPRCSGVFSSLTVWE